MRRSIVVAIAIAIALAGSLSAFAETAASTLQVHVDLKSDV
jgi:hypothetical protein